MAVIALDAAERQRRFREGKKKCAASYWVDADDRVLEMLRRRVAAFLEVLRNDRVAQHGDDDAQHWNADRRRRWLARVAAVNAEGSPKFSRQGQGGICKREGPAKPRPASQLIFAKYGRIHFSNVEF